MKAKTMRNEEESRMALIAWHRDLNTEPQSVDMDLLMNWWNRGWLVPKWYSHGPTWRLTPSGLRVIESARLATDAFLDTDSTSRQIDQPEPPANRITDP